MIAVGGFFGAYTYVQKGGVFCNAQTANFVLMAVHSGAEIGARRCIISCPLRLICSARSFRNFCPSI